MMNRSITSSYLRGVSEHVKHHESKWGATKAPAATAAAKLHLSISPIVTIAASNGAADTAVVLGGNEEDAEQLRRMLEEKASYGVHIAGTGAGRSPRRSARCGRPALIRPREGMRAAGQCQAHARAGHLPCW